MSNEFIDIKSGQLRNNKPNIWLTSKIKQSYKQIHKKLDPFLNSQEAILNTLFEKSKKEKYNYLKLLQKQSANQYRLSNITISFLTEWISQFNPDAKEKVIELRILSNSQHQLFQKSKVPNSYLNKNVHKHDSDELYFSEPNNIYVGEYCNHD